MSDNSELSYLVYSIWTRVTIMWCHCAPLYLKRVTWRYYWKLKAHNGPNSLSKCHRLLLDYIYREIKPQDLDISSLWCHKGLIVPPTSIKNVETERRVLIVLSSGALQKLSFLIWTEQELFLLGLMFNFKKWAKSAFFLLVDLQSNFCPKICICF